MPIGSGATRGRNPAVNSVSLETDVIDVAALAVVLTPELVCGINTGVNVLFWMRQTVGANPLTAQLEFLKTIDTGGIDQWERVVDPFVLPALGLVSRNVFQQVARRYRIQFTGPATASTVRYHLSSWAQ